MNRRIAVIRLRGTIKARKEIGDTMKMLRLYKTNTCIIIKNSPELVGMINTIKDYTTWGEIDDKTMKELLIKRGRLAGNKPIDENYIKGKTKMSAEEFTKMFMDFKKELRDIPGLKLFFRLNPPRHGFDNKSIKRTFVQGGALGYRKEKINDLIMRML
ncbi:MAG: 50S ribosomal protein L30 [Candidatus Nanoarchaeia archaeon]|nr:50S ribosomal protein L30 [Candidatus Nanoarchaeia archaeon]